MELNTINYREIDIPKSIKWTWIRMACYSAVVLVCFIVMGDHEFKYWDEAWMLAIPVIMAIAALGCFETYEFAQPKKPVTEYLRKYKAIWMGGGIVITAIMIPTVWYLEAFDTPLEKVFEAPQYSFVRDCFAGGGMMMFLGIMSIEGIALNNIYDGVLPVPLWKPIVTVPIAIFGLVGIKYFNLWLMDYAHGDFLMSMALIFSLTVLPIGFALVLISYVFVEMVD